MLIISPTLWSNSSNLNSWNNWSPISLGCFFSEEQSCSHTAVMETVFLSSGDFLLPSYLLQGKGQAACLGRYPWGLASAIRTHKTRSNIEKLKTGSHIIQPCHVWAYSQRNQRQSSGCTTMLGKWFTTAALWHSERQYQWLKKNMAYTHKGVLPSHKEWNCTICRKTIWDRRSS